MWKHVIVVLTAASLLGCHGNLNIYITRQETMRLLGLQAELYYIRDGVLNQYALKFNVPIPANISELNFTWRSLVEKRLPYSITVDVSDQSALLPPKANISMVGFVPYQTQTFKIVLPCNGLVDAEVDVNISINVTLDKRNVTAVTLKRKKICLKRQAAVMPDSDSSKRTPPVYSGNQSGVSVDTPPEVSESESDSALYAAVGCACALLAILALLSSACCARNRHKARRQDVIHDSRMVANSQLTGPLLHPNAYMLPPPVVPMLPPPVMSMPTPNNFHHGAPPIIAPAGSSSAKSAASSYASFSSRRQPSRHHDSAHSVLGGAASAASVCQAPSVITSRDDRTHDLHERIVELTIQRCRVRLQSVVQEGTFGRVYLGSYADSHTMEEEEVIVKTVADHASQVQVSLLLQEGMCMYALTHPNLLAVRGVSIEDHTAPFLIYPYKGYTNLKRFLLQCRQCNGEGGMAHSLTTQQLVDMALQVNAGLHYLHRKQIIHKDIAARNCVVDSSLRIQIADNALARDLFPMDYHCLGDNENRPVKWMAPEALTHHEFTTKSDVWAYGVLLWELATLSQQPYAEIDPFEMADYLRNGYRLIQPVNCPDELFGTMAYCWSTSPKERPSAPQLDYCLQTLYNQLNRFV